MRKFIYLQIVIVFLLVAGKVLADTGASDIYDRGREFWMHGQLKEAAKYFKKIRAPGSELAEKAALAYLYAELELGEIEAAEEGFYYFIQNYPESGFISVSLQRVINLLVSQGEYARAEFFLHILHLSVEENNAQEVRMAMVINCYLGLLQYNNAKKSIEEYLARFPLAEGAAYYRLWLVWYDLKQNNAGIQEELKKLAESQDNVDTARRAKKYLVPLLIRENKNEEAVKYMLELHETGENYTGSELLWLAKYLRDMRELTVAEAILQEIIANSESNMIQAIALNDLAQVQTEERKFHDALSNYPLVQKALLNSEAGVGQIELLAKISDYSNALTLRKIGSTARAHVILNRLQPAVYESLYYQILYEQGLVAMNMGDVALGAGKLMRAGILANDPDLAGKALLKCCEACKMLNNPKLLKICVEELIGKNEGSYGKLYPNSPYTAQAYELLEAAE